MSVITKTKYRIIDENGKVSFQKVSKTVYTNGQIIQSVVSADKRTVIGYLINQTNGKLTDEIKLGLDNIPENEWYSKTRDESYLHLASKNRYAQVFKYMLELGHNPHTQYIFNNTDDGLNLMNILATGEKTNFMLAIIPYLRYINAETLNRLFRKTSLDNIQVLNELFKHKLVTEDLEERVYQLWSAKTKIHKNKYINSVAEISRIILKFGNPDELPNSLKDMFIF